MWIGGRHAKHPLVLFSDFAASLLDARMQIIPLPVPFLICEMEAIILSSFVDHFEMGWESAVNSRLQSPDL